MTRHAFLSGGGEAGALLRARDWSGSPLGEPSTWAQSLRSMVGLMLTSRFPMFVAWGDDLGFLYNDAYAVILGAKHPDALGKRFQDVWGEIWTDILPMIDTALAGEATYHENLPLVMNRSGFDEQTWFTFSYSPVRDESGRVAGIFCACTETTGQVLAERMVRESEARLRLVQAAGGIGSFDYDLRRDEAVCSPEYYALFGLPVGHPINRETWTAAIHPDDRHKAVEALNRAAAERAPFDYEYRIVRTDTGEVRWLSGRAAVIFDEEDRPWRYVGGNIDVTGRKRAEERLRELNETLEAQVAERTAERDRLWRNTQDVQVVINGAGVFQAVSPAFTHILGWASEEVIGRTVFDFIIPEDGEPSSAALEHAQADALPVFENRYRHKDGGFRWISWVASSEGALIYASGRHVTEQKEQAAALAMAEAALRQAQKMEAVGQLTGGLAHDFNNILAGISGSLDMMETRIAQGRIADVERYMRAAQGAAKRAAALTHRLLAFSRRQTLEPKPTDVNRLVAGMEELVRRTVGPSIEVEAVATGGLWLTLVDPHQLENALLNLCINARDAMPGGGKITIETANRWLDDRAGKHRDLPPGQYVSMCVSDNGTGMSAEVVEKAFDPFFTTKPIGQGTGLGLSMIYGFARQSGGQVQIYSEVGQGTMVCLYLPRYHGQEAAEQPEPFEAMKPAAVGRTVLVIDDEPLVRMLVVDVLEDLGYAALEAGDGPEGLKVLRSAARIDLLITDVGLPNGMNGRQVADAARELRPSLKVLFVTGYAENAVLSHGHLDPGMAVVTKPFDMARLASRIRDMIADQ